MGEPAGRIVAVEGPPGIGKSRLVRFLAEETRGTLRIEEAFDRLDRRVSLAVPDRSELARVERRLLREERRRFREAMRTRATGRTVLVDTGFLGPLTYSLALARLDPPRDVVALLLRQYERAARLGTLGMPDLTLRLRAPPGLIARRVAADPVRTGDRWAARHARVSRTEETLWRGPIAGVLGPRLVWLDARGSVDRVAALARRALAARGSPGPWVGDGPAGSLRAVLAALGRRAATLKKRTRSASPPRR